MLIHGRTVTVFCITGLSSWFSVDLQALTMLKGQANTYHALAPWADVLHGALRLTGLGAWLLSCGTPAHANVTTVDKTAVHGPAVHWDEPIFASASTNARARVKAKIPDKSPAMPLADRNIPQKAAALLGAATGLQGKFNRSSTVVPRSSGPADKPTTLLAPAWKAVTTASIITGDATPTQDAKPANAVSPRASAGSRHAVADRRPVNAKPVAEWLLLTVSVNGTSLSDVVRAEQRPDGSLLLPADAWTEARLVAPAQEAALSDGTPGYALGSIAGLTYTMNRQTLSLEISAPAVAFVDSTLGIQGGVPTSALRPSPGVMLNYDVAVTHADRKLVSGAVLEAVAFSRFGNFITSAVVRNGGGGGAQDGTTASRLDTYWRSDLPDRMETLVIGDTVGVGGGWSRPVRYGGLRWGRNFDTRPGFLTLPQIALAGEAALPSTVEVLLNNARRISQQTQPGPFNVPNVPIVTGAGEISLVVRDLLGRETVVRQSYYASPQLLAPHLSDFSFEAGWMRTGYGRETAYAHPFGAGTWRQGLTNALTGEMRLELQRERRAAGAQLTSLLGHWAVGRVAAAASSDNAHGSNESGVMWQSSIERTTLGGGAALQYEHASRGFAPFGESNIPTAMQPRARERWLATVGAPLWNQINGGVSYVSQTRWDGERVQLVGASVSLPLWLNVSLSVSFSKRLDGDKGWRAAASISFPLDGGVHAAVRLDQDDSGHQNVAFTAAHNAPAGPGLGWRVGADASASESARAQGGLQYNTSQAEGMIEAQTDTHGEVAVRASARGTLGLLEGKTFASRPVGESSVAVVKVDGIEGVPVKRSHQVVAVTDARGLAFVPGLLPWQKNIIEIDPVDLPLDVEIASPTRELTPYPRSGIAVDFEARRSRQALLVLQQRDGTPVPIGTRVRLLPAGPEFSAGRRGEVWLTDLSDTRQRVQASWLGGGCVIELALPTTGASAMSKLGPLVCDAGHP